MAQQWRVPCDECGREVSEKLRMHTQLSASEARDHFKADPRDDHDEEEKSEGTFVKCNNCGNVREVEN